MKKLKRPIFEKFGMMDYEGYTESLEEYCDQLESERDELKESEELAYMAKGLAQKGYRNLEKELQTLQDAVKKFCKYYEVPTYFMNDKEWKKFIEDIDAPLDKLKKLIK